MFSWFEIDEMKVEKELTTEKEVEDEIKSSAYHRYDFQKKPYDY